MHRFSQEEKEYLEKYDITKFDRPSIAADMAVFSVMGNRGEEETRAQENSRTLPEKKLKILLIERASHPYKGHWALPGGFCRKGEEIYDTARRELLEETQVADAYLKLVGVFGKKEGTQEAGLFLIHFLHCLTGKSIESGREAMHGTQDGSI